MEQEATNPSPNSIQAQIEYLDRVVASSQSQSAPSNGLLNQINTAGNTVTYSPLTYQELENVVRDVFYTTDMPVVHRVNPRPIIYGTGEEILDFNYGEVFFNPEHYRGRKSRRTYDDYIEGWLKPSKIKKPYSVLDNIKLIK